MPEEIKNNEDKNLQRLREEFNQRRNQNENHPKTSHGIKHYMSHNVSNNDSKKFHSCNKSSSVRPISSHLLVNKGTSINVRVIQQPPPKNLWIAYTLLCRVPRGGFLRHLK